MLKEILDVSTKACLRLVEVDRTLWTANFVRKNTTGAENLPGCEAVHILADQERAQLEQARRDMMPAFTRANAGNWAMLGMVGLGSLSGIAGLAHEHAAPSIHQAPDLNIHFGSGVLPTPDTQAAQVVSMPIIETPADAQAMHTAIAPTAVVQAMKDFSGDTWWKVACETYPDNNVTLCYPDVKRGDLGVRVEQATVKGLQAYRFRLDGKKEPQPISGVSGYSEEITISNDPMYKSIRIFDLEVGGIEGLGLDWVILTPKDNTAPKSMFVGWRAVGDGGQSMAQSIVQYEAVLMHIDENRNIGVGVNQAGQATVVGEGTYDRGTGKWTALKILLPGGSYWNATVEKLLGMDPGLGVGEAAELTPTPAPTPKIEATATPAEIVLAPIASGEMIAAHEGLTFHMTLTPEKQQQVYSDFIDSIALSPEWKQYWADWGISHPTKEAVLAFLQKSVGGPENKPFWLPLKSPKGTEFLLLIGKGSELGKFGVHPGVKQFGGVYLDGLRYEIHSRTDWKENRQGLSEWLLSIFTRNGGGDEGALIYSLGNDGAAFEIGLSVADDARFLFTFGTRGYASTKSRNEGLIGGAWEQTSSVFRPGTDPKIVSAMLATYLGFLKNFGPGDSKFVDKHIVGYVCVNDRTLCPSSVNYRDLNKEQIIFSSNGTE